MTDKFLEYLKAQVTSADKMRRELKDIDDCLKLYDDHHMSKVTMSFTSSEGATIYLDSYRHSFLFEELIANLRKYRETLREEYNNFQIRSSSELKEENK